MTTIDEVRARLGGWGGPLVSPSDAGFDDVAPVVFAGDGAAPALVARPRDVGEVSAAVRAAAETGVPFAVRGGGHAYARYGTVPGGLVLDLRLLGGVRIDPERRVGTASAGTTAGDYTAAAAGHGLATGFGDTLSVGVPGLALGGGIGYLSRRDGLTLDNVLGAEVVLADGSVVRASDDENPGLFWALRGAAGTSASSRASTSGSCRRRSSRVGCSRSSPTRGPSACSSPRPPLPPTSSRSWSTS